METINANPPRRLVFRIVCGCRRCGLQDRSPNAMIALQCCEDSGMVFQKHESKNATFRKHPRAVFPCIEVRSWCWVGIGASPPRPPERVRQIAHHDRFAFIVCIAGLKEKTKRRRRTTPHNVKTPHMHGPPPSDGRRRRATTTGDDGDNDNTDDGRRRRRATTTTTTQWR
jgi:hypothetical protein